MTLHNGISIFNKKQWLLWLFMLFAFLFYFGFYKGWNKADTDFTNYYIGSVAAAQGNGPLLYNVEAFNKMVDQAAAGASGLFLMYPPPTVFLQRAFIGLSMVQAKQVWMLINAGLLLLLIFQGRVHSKLSAQQVAILLLLSGFNMANDFYLGQVYVLMLLLTVIGFKYYYAADDNLAAIFWGMVAAIKYLPLLFIPMLFFTGRFKLILKLLLVVFIIHLACFNIYGADFYVAYFKAFSDNLLAGKVANQLPLSPQYQSFASLFYQFSDFNSASKDQGLFFLGRGLVIALLILGLIYTLARYAKTSRLSWAFPIALIPLALLLEAGSASYHLLFCFIPLLLVVADDAVISRNKVMLTVAYAALGFLPTVLFKFAQQLDSTLLLFTYSRLWCLVLFYIISLWILYKTPIAKTYYNDLAVLEH
ncbi:MAG: hypothetical protein RIQ89_481 [Bacteroidota bacterium]|jgi:hypothetical protein